MNEKSVEELIEASSLGTPAAKAFRESVSEEEAQRLVDRAQAIEAVQSAVVGAINTLGVTLVGSKFTPITVSPIPDDEVAQIFAGSLPVGVESNQETQK